jgi:micrococcal nuclease
MMLTTLSQRIYQCFCFCKKPAFSRDTNHTSLSGNLFLPSINSPVLTPILWKDTTPFIPPISGGQVIKVYDGDTITIVARMPYKNSPLYRFPVRFRGIDSPEINGLTEEEKQCAIQARDALSQLILHKYVTLKNTGNEKYGRILADVYLENFHINEWLLKERYAVPYDGGTKRTPKSWAKYRITGEA